MCRTIWKELHKLDINALVDLLAIHMNEYHNLMRDGTVADNKLSKTYQAIKAIQKEIESRKQKKDDLTPDYNGASN